MPNCTYKFWALAPDVVDVVTNKLNGQITTHDKETASLAVEDWGSLPNKDYVYSCLSTDANSSNGTATLEFNHIISKVNLSFKNLVDPNIKLEVTNITFTVPGAGGVDINGSQITPQWSSFPTTLTFDNIDKVLNYIDETLKNNEETLDEYERVLETNTANTDAILVWPNNNVCTYTVSFDVTLTIPATRANTTKITGTIDKALKVGTAYNFVVNITPEAINSGNVDIQAEEIPGWNTITEAQQFALAAKLGGMVTLSEDVDISSTLDVLDNLTINLNGKTLSYDGANTLFNVVEPATLTINGNDIETSSIVSTTAAYLAAANEGSNIIINGGNHTTAGSSAYITTGGSISVTDGSFKSAPVIDEDSNQTYKTLHIEDETMGTIIVSGGAFFKWDPSNGDTEFQDSKNYLKKPESNNSTIEHIVIENKPMFHWYFVTKKYIVYDNDNDGKENIIGAFTDPDVGIIDMTSNIDYGDETFTLSHREDLTLNMNGNTFTGNSTFYSGNIFYDTSLTINDGTFMDGGFQAAYGTKLILNNCNINIQSNKKANQVYCIILVEAEVIINGGTFTIDTNGKHSYIYGLSPSNTYILYNTMGTPATSSDTATSGKPIIENGSTANVVIYGGRYGFDPSDWKAPGANVTGPDADGIYEVSTPGIETSVATDKKVTTIIKSGTFSFNPTPWVTVGYEVIENDNKTWTVQQIAQ